MTVDAGAPLLVVQDLRVHYTTREGNIPAVDGVDLELGQGEVVGIVGESGCGKSTLVRAIINLLDRSYTTISSGSVVLGDLDILNLSRKQLDAIRGRQISMIFQNPQTALNPVYTVGSQIAEALKVHGYTGRTQIRERIVDLLRQVGIPAPEQRLHDYPHQLSGGMQQRIGIAIALACEPRLLIADEPTTALDVTIQAQILRLIRSINESHGMSMILVSHNLGIVAQLCSRTIVMYGGVVVEEAPTSTLFDQPAHPYTQGLLRSIPRVESRQAQLQTIPGRVPRFSGEVNHCRFVDRCPVAIDACRESEPPLVEIGEEHRSRCWLHLKSGAA